MAAWDYTPGALRRGCDGFGCSGTYREALETQVQELKSVQDLLMRLLATTRPLASMLEFYGGTEATERALYGLLDELAANARGPKPRQPTFSVLPDATGGDPATTTAPTTNHAARCGAKAECPWR